MPRLIKRGRIRQVRYRVNGKIRRKSLKTTIKRVAEKKLSEFEEKEVLEDSGVVLKDKPESLRQIARRYLENAKIADLSLVRHRQCLFGTKRDDHGEFIEGTGPLLEFFGGDRNLRTIRSGPLK